MSRRGANLHGPEGHPVRAGAVVTRFPTDFLPHHLGIVLKVFDLRNAAGELIGYTANVLVIDDGRRTPYQVLTNVMVCTGTPNGALAADLARPRESDAGMLAPAQLERLERDGYLAQDLPFDAYNGDWCVVSYIGGNERKPFISAFWPNPNLAAGGSGWPAPLIALGASTRALEERVRARRDALGLSDIPVPFLLAWIQKESGGLLNGASNDTGRSSHPPVAAADQRRTTEFQNSRSLDEHGYFQLDWRESVTLGLITGTPPALDFTQHDLLLTDGDYSIDQGIRLVDYYRRKYAGTVFGGPQAAPADFWTYVKFIHGAGSGAAPATLRAVTAKLNGRAPASWPELYGVALQLIAEGTLTPSIQRRLDNASKVGSVLAIPAAAAAPPPLRKVTAGPTSASIDASGNVRISTTGRDSRIGALGGHAPDAGGAAGIVPEGGHVELDLRAGSKLRVLADGQPLVTITHDGQGPRFKIGRRGRKDWERAVLGKALVRYFNEAFLPALLAKLQALEAQFERFYRDEYAQHTHQTAWGPTPTGPLAPPANPDAAVFQDETAADPPPAQPGRRDPPLPAVPAGKKTRRGTLPEMIDDELLSRVLNLPDAASAGSGRTSDEEA